LEIVPQTDPVELLERGGRLEVQVLWEREPLAGVNVVATPRDGSGSSARPFVTDEIGMARVDLDAAGSWIISVVHAGQTEDEPRGRVESTATLVLTAGPPQ
jgi:uncharacterized GH25 family protein